MFNNDNFKSSLARSGMTMYKLSKYSGIPYTTINEIRNGKIDINQCAAATVCKLAAALSVEPDGILNEIHYLDGIKGKYKGIDYIWSSADCSEITFEYEGDKVTLSAGAFYNIPSRIKYYNVIAGWMIKEYIAHREWEARIRSKIERAAANE